jgi:Leucine-rich repeat (LRR) protein
MNNKIVYRFYKNILKTTYLFILILFSCGIKNLIVLSLDGSHIKDKDSLELIAKLNSLESISLDRFPDYKKVLDILPETMDQISLEYNGINSIKEIEFLKEKYPSLRYVYVRGNNFTVEDISAERHNWFPVELCWAVD